MITLCTRSPGPMLALPLLLTTTLAALPALAADKPVSSFVKQEGGQLTLNGKPFRFGGTNNYYMHYKSNEAIDDVLDNAAAMGLKVIRIWGFMDGIDASGFTIQPELGKYVPTSKAKNALERLDYTVSQAKKKGIRVVLVMTNNWPNFGGMPQYVKWAGGSQHDEFYTRPELRQAYKDYVKFILTHKNQYTGVPYNKEPAIMTIQLTNEARAQTDKSGDLLVNWTREMSDYVRTLAPKQLISLGSEGFFCRKGHQDWTYNCNEGVDWERIIALPNINYEVIHMYTDQWGKKDAEQWGSQWIKDHIAAAKVANKPTVLEEYGISTTLPYNRDLIYERWNRVAYENGAAGSMFWILTGKDPESKDGIYPDYDGYRILNDGSRTTQILKDYAAKFNGQAVQLNDKAYFAKPVNNWKVSDAEFDASVYPMLYGTTAKSVTLQVGGKSYPMQDSDNDGYYTVHLKSADIGYGQQQFKVDVVKSDGSTVSETIKAEINKPVLAYEPVTVYDFSQGTAGWVKEGTWQADWKNPAVEATKELGKPMLKANVIWSGKNDWEEVKLRNMRVLNFRKSVRMSFDTLIPAEGIFTGELRPYAALGDGWVKLDTDKNNKAVGDLERVNIGGKMFIKHHVEINMGDVAGRGPDVFIGLVGNKLKYDGPIYIDNLTFYAAKR